MKQKRILIADDDAALVRVLVLRCKHIGLHVIGCHDAMHALTLIHKDPPDLIIFDVNMPAGDGIAASEMLAADKRLRHIPIIVMTGQSRDGYTQRCETLGAEYVLKEGDVWQRLKPLISKLLDLKKAA